MTSRDKNSPMESAILEVRDLLSCLRRVIFDGRLDESVKIIETELRKGINQLEELEAFMYSARAKIRVNLFLQSFEKNYWRIRLYIPEKIPLEFAYSWHKAYVGDDGTVWFKEPGKNAYHALDELDHGKIIDAESDCPF